MNFCKYKPIQILITLVKILLTIKIIKMKKTLKKFDGFCRGLSFHGDFAFIGFSKLRKNSSTFAKLSFSDKANFSGIKIIHMPTNAEDVVNESQYGTSESVN